MSWMLHFMTKRIFTEYPVRVCHFSAKNSVASSDQALSGLAVTEEETQILRIRV